MPFPNNSTKFKPGKSGNPNGRPKKLPKLDELLADILTDEEDGVCAAKAILIALRKKAMKGDTRAAELLMDRAWGKALQSMNLSVETKVNELDKLSVEQLKNLWEIKSVLEN